MASGYVALLRAVNVGGTGAVSMSDLSDRFGAWGFQDVRTYLVSGNVVFRARATPPGALESKLEAALEKDLKLRTPVMVRDGQEMSTVLSENPFPSETQEAPHHVHVVFLKGTPPSGAERALQGAIVGPERVTVRGRHAYVVYPDGSGRSKLTLRLMERHLGHAGTARNWNTVARLHGMLQAS